VATRPREIIANHCGLGEISKGIDEIIKWHHRTNNHQGKKRQGKNHEQQTPMKIIKIKLGQMEYPQANQVEKYT